MKCILLLLPFIAACVSAAAVADASAAEPKPDASAASAESVPDSLAESSNAEPASASIAEPSASVDSVPLAAEYVDNYGGYGGYGGYYGSGYENRRYEGRRNNEYREGEYRNGGYQDDRYRENRYREGGYREGGVKENEKERGYNNNRNWLGVYEGDLKEYFYDGKDYRMFFIPKLVGRQGLGFQKRNYFSGGMRFPITPEILEPIGYRPLVKELYFEPLQKYNYN